MYKYYLFILLFVLLSSCSPEEVGFSNLIEPIDFSQSENFIADGQSSILVKVRFAEDVDISDIDAVVTLDTRFATHAESDDEEYVLEPEVFGNGRVRAEFEIKSTTRAGNFNIQLDINQYRRIYPFESFVSFPYSMSLSKSSNSAQAGFIGEVTIEGLILNELGSKASQGVRVRFKDTFADGSPAGGVFRAENLMSNSQSKVSAIYSPGQISENQFITIHAEVLDSGGNPTDINESTEIFAYTE